MEIKKLLDNRGFSIMNTMVAMGLAAIYMAGEQAQKNVERTMEAREKATFEVEEYLLAGGTDLINSAVTGVDFSSGSFAPFTAAIPVPAGMSNVDAINISFTGPNSDLNTTTKFAPAQLEISSRGAVKRYPVVTSVYVDTSDIGIGGKVIGGKEQAIRACQSSGGDWQPNPAKCLFGRSLGVEADANTFFAFAALDGALLETLDYFATQVNRDYTNAMALRMTELIGHINASPSIDAATKTNLTTVAQSIASDFGSNEGLHNTLETLGANARGMQSDVAAWWWWGKYAPPGSPVVGPIKIGTFTVAPNGGSPYYQMDSATSSELNVTSFSGATGH